MNKIKTILIGIDGCDFRILRPLLEDGHLPTFSEILKHGSHGTLISTIPPNSPPAWTSIFTGVNPGKHGITDFNIREGSQIKLANSRHRMVESIWSILNRFGFHQIIVNEPVTYPPEKIYGVMLTGFSTPLSSNNFAYPSKVKMEIENACGTYEPKLPFGFEKIIAENEDAGYALITNFAEKRFHVTKYLAKNYNWDLLSIIFTSTDRLQHFYFDKQQYILAYYKMLDGMIKSIMALDPEANVFIVSDHGFGPLKKCFYINTWLKEHGFLTEKRNFLTKLLSAFGLTYKNIVSTLLFAKIYHLIAKVTPQSIKNEIPKNVGESLVEYNRSKCFSVGANSGLYFNYSPAFSNVLSLVTDMLKSNTINGEYPVETVCARDDVLWGPYSNRGPNVYLLPKYGYEISPRLTSKNLTTPKTFGDIRTGTHTSEGIFIAYGPDINERLKLKRFIHTWDITPTLLHSLGIPIPSYMDGHVLKEIFREDSDPATRPITYTCVSERERLKTKIKKIKRARGI